MCVCVCGGCTWFMWLPRFAGKQRTKQNTYFLDVSQYFISWGWVSLNWRLPSLSRRLARKLSGRSLSNCLQHPRLGLWEATPSFSEKCQGFRLGFSRLNSKHFFSHWTNSALQLAEYFLATKKPLLICCFSHMSAVCDTGVSTILYCCQSPWHFYTLYAAGERMVTNAEAYSYHLCHFTAHNLWLKHIKGSCLIIAKLHCTITWVCCSLPKLDEMNALV